MPTWLHVVLCLVVPPVWGIAMVRVYDALDRRRKAADRASADPQGAGPGDFMI